MCPISAKAAIEHATNDDELLKLYGVVLAGWLLIAGPAMVMVTDASLLAPLATLGGTIGLHLLLIFVGPAVVAIGTVAIAYKVTADLR